MINIELANDRLYQRKFTTSLETTILNLCSYCFLEECYQFGCIGETKDGKCQCRLDHDNI